MVSTKTRTKNIVLLLALLSMTFILSIVSYAIPQPQQAFAQGFFQSQQESLAVEPNNNQSTTSSSTPLTTATAIGDSRSETEEEDDRKIILCDITIPITSNTTLSLETLDSKITVEPNT